MHIADHRAVYSALSPPPSEEAKARAGLTFFFSLAQEWGLSPDEQRILLGNPGRTTFYKWRREKCGALSRDTFDRLSHLIGIYKALNILYSDNSALEWVKNSNHHPLFNGRSPLQHLLRGGLSEIIEVRGYLDWARG